MCASHIAIICVYFNFNFSWFRQTKFPTDLVICRSTWKVVTTCAYRNDNSANHKLNKLTLKINGKNKVRRIKKRVATKSEQNKRKELYLCAIATQQSASTESKSNKKKNYYWKEAATNRKDLKPKFIHW